MSTRSRNGYDTKTSAATDRVDDSISPSSSMPSPAPREEHDCVLVAVVANNSKHIEALLHGNAKLQEEVVASKDEARKEHELRIAAEQRHQEAEKLLEATREVSVVQATPSPNSHEDEDDNGLGNTVAEQGLVAGEQNQGQQFEEQDGSEFDDDLSEEEKTLMQQFGDIAGHQLVMEKRKNRYLAKTMVKDRETATHFMQKSYHLSYLLEERHGSRGDLEDVLKGKDEYMNTLLKEMSLLEDTNKQLRRELLDKERHEDKVSNLKDKLEQYKTAIRMINASKREYQNLNADLIERSKRNLALDDFSRALEDELKITRAENTALDNRVVNLRLEVDQLSDTKAHFKDDLEDQQAENLEAKERVVTLERQVSNLTAELDATRLSHEFSEDTHEKAVQQHERALAERDRRIGDFKAQMDSLADRISSYETLQLSEQQRIQFEAKNREIAQAKAQAQALERKLHELGEVVTERDRTIYFYRSDEALRLNNEYTQELASRQKEKKISELEREASEMNHKMQERDQLHVERLRNLEDAADRAQHEITTRREIAEDEASHARKANAVNILWLKELIVQLCSWLRRLEEEFQAEGGSIMQEDESIALMAACDDTVAVLEKSTGEGTDLTHELIAVVDKYSPVSSST